jgi:transcriptional regulator with GAF, ATPase, and Fis domain
MDQNDFFRNATLKISSSLDIEKALWRFLRYVQDIIPVNQMFIHLYSPETGIAETIAKATSDGFQSLSEKTPLPKESREKIKAQRSIRVKLISNSSEDAVGKHLCKVLGFEGLPAMLLDLVIESNFLADVSFIGFPGKQFNQDHVALVSQLNEPFAIAVSNSIRYRKIQRYKELLEDDNKYLNEELTRIGGGHELIGAESGLNFVMKLVEQVAPMDSPVLLLGETGVGKDLVARKIHQLSPRHTGPFIDVNCGAIPESLVDSELFGHEKGSFTGATSKKRGRFERAQNGTIFLDEIGELSHDAQVRLLRVLQENQFERVGGTNSINLNVRLIAATHRNLKKMVGQGRFRQDLFFRINVFPIIIPPLRERIQDIPALVQHFIKKKANIMNLGFTPVMKSGALDRLMKYPWPGNVRELENEVERALVLSHGLPISFNKATLLDSNIAGSSSGIIPTSAADHGSTEMEDLNLDRVIISQIQKALLKARGKVDGEGGAAQLLGINPRTLRHRMRKLKIPFGRNATNLYRT